MTPFARETSRASRRPASGGAGGVLDRGDVAGGPGLGLEAVRPGCGPLTENVEDRISRSSAPADVSCHSQPLERCPLDGGGWLVSRGCLRAVAWRGICRRPRTASTSVSAPTRRAPSSARPQPLRVPDWIDGPTTGRDPRRVPVRCLATGVATIPRGPRRWRRLSGSAVGQRRDRARRRRDDCDAPRTRQGTGSRTRPSIHAVRGRPGAGCHPEEGREPATLVERGGARAEGRDPARRADHRPAPGEGEPLGEEARPVVHPGGPVLPWPGRSRGPASSEGRSRPRVLARESRPGGGCVPSARAAPPCAIAPPRARRPGVPQRASPPSPAFCSPASSAARWSRRQAPTSRRLKAA